MPTRQIKDAKDLATNELIYFKGHAQATYMSDGTTVEDAINNIQLSGGGTSSGGSNITAATISGWGFTKNIGTITGITMNGSSVGTSGIVDLGTVITDVSSKQDKLVSGTSIRTINGISILGSGNIKIGNKTLTTTTSTSISLSPNVYYRKTNTSTTLTITLASASDSTIMNEYFIEFTTSSSGTTISLPSSVKWVNGEAPTFEANKTYQISIVNNLGVCTKFG